ncbi:unnamed protein product [Ilex paraguariensis]|uniref:Uncharacterized protein n=1 Tax=Ilex paraguariensis TaxID=185542 RepID=A0ABC8UX86_9AQUA
MMKPSGGSGGWTSNDHPRVSSQHSEAAAVREACVMVTTQQMQNATIESNNASIINFSVTEEAPARKIAAFMDDIRECANTPRTTNKPAHWITKKCLSQSLPLDWVVFHTRELGSLLSVDWISFLNR